MKEKLRPLVVVLWEDASNHTGESLQEAIKSPQMVKTYGVLVHEDRDLTIVMTHDGQQDDENGNDYMRIPTPLVRRIARFKEAK